MTDWRSPAAVASRQAALSIFIIALAGAGILIVLALTGGGAAQDAIGAAGIVLLGAALALRRLRSGRGPPAVESPVAAGWPAPSSAPFAAALQAMADPILLIAAQPGEGAAVRRFIFANRAARDLLGISRDEGPLTTAVRAPEVLAAVETALGGGLGEALYEPAGARDRVWRARAALVSPAAPGQPSLVLLTLRDETEMRRGERTRADFLANASHELRTPLASLTGFIETLRGHARNDQAAREAFLPIMQAQAERMRRLIDDLMNLSRIELGEHIPPAGEVDVILVAGDVVDALGPLAGERGVRFQAPRAPAAGQALVTGERDQIVQVIQNLAENAIKFTPAGGTIGLEITVGVDVAGAPACEAAARFALLSPDHGPGARYVALRVSDQGPGIARADMPRLTERFYRVEGQKSGDKSGTGLGLAIVKHIVNRHRGALTVESAEGRGCTFTVYFPMPDERQGAAITA
jgi:two-component system phosphate regulon sensor histidine kinase PhoR